MKPELQRIAIAEACGWTFRTGNMVYDGEKMPFTIWIKDGVEFNPSSVPDYLTDRNAMHEAFLSLDDQQKQECLGYLYQCARRNHHDKDVALAMATLPDWSQSILRALRVWDAA